MRNLLLAGIVLAAGLIAAPCGLAQDGVVSIDYVSNEVLSSTSLSAGSTHRVSIRYDFLDLAPPEGSTGYWTTRNGFEIYSPDGANWNYLQGTKGPLLDEAANPLYLVMYRRHYYFDGSTWSLTGSNGSVPAPGSGGLNTRAGYLLACLDFTGSSLTGFSGGTSNGIALYLEFSTLLADNGRTICIDTSTLDNQPWEWKRYEQPDPPLWDNGLGSSGPRCWSLVACPNMPPEWCNGYAGDVQFAYCQQASYQLCVVEFCYPAIYALAPPFDNGDYGSVDQESGLWTWSGPTVPPGSSVDIQFRGGDINGYNDQPFVLHVTVTTDACQCCSARVGDANGLGGDEPTIADVSAIIDHLFISRNPLPCYPEADVNQSGGPYPLWDDITISDVSSLVDYLFITGPQNATLRDCL